MSEQQSTEVDLDTSANTHVLFLDMAEMAELRGVVQAVCPAEKHPRNPIMPLGDVDEWDCRRNRVWSGRTVMYDEEDGLFKCWYDGIGFHNVPWRIWKPTGYAVSDDGVHWEKPVLGLFQYAQSTNNNICHMRNGPMIKDTSEPDPAHRYKMVSRHYPEMRVYVHYSPDGIHWDEKVEIDHVFHDMVHFMRDDYDPDPGRRYKLIWQDGMPTKYPDLEGVRVKMLSYGPDERHLRPHPGNPILHPDDGTERENHFLLVHQRHRYYIMLYEHGWYLPNDTGNHGQYLADIRLAVSRDGMNYQRILIHEPVLGRGEYGEWDDGFLVISDQLVIRNDTVYVYYTGMGHDWTSWPGAKVVGNTTFDNWTGLRSARIGLATLPLDRFTCLRTADGEKPGYAVTQPIEVREATRVQLTVNVSDVIPRRDWVEVEILDAATGSVIAGFERQACEDIERDRVRIPVAWQDKTLADIDASRIQLRFWIYGDAKLHAFSFSGPEARE